MECANIYNKLNKQPHLQEIIRNYYYDGILNDQAKDAKFHVLDTLNYAFKNARTHQKQIYGWIEDENYFLRFIRHSVFYEVIRNGKLGPQIYGFRGIIEQYYGNDWNDYYNYEYDEYDSEDN
tara:strand:+ start:725 stop:1090 length:366 start_codon:yes stop_codon:yes gene_type:complete